MSDRLSISMIAALAATALVGSAAFAAPYSISTTGTGSNNFSIGQNFTPSLGGSPNPGLTNSDPVQLTSFNFTKATGTAGNAATRLVLLNGAYPDTNGAANNAPATLANALAVSTNTIDTTAGAAADGTSLNFNFANPVLTYGNNYTVAFATVGAGDVLTFIPVAVRYANFVETAPGSGVFQPASNYGGANNFNAVALYADSNNDGFFQADNSTADLVFTANFQTVPEPASLAALLAVGTLVGRRRR